MKVIGERYPVSVHQFESGSDIATWVVPPEWRAVEGALYDGDALVASQEECALFVAPYSVSFSGVLAREELLAHTLFSTDMPDAFLYEFRLAYNYSRRLKEWRISLPYDRVARLGRGPFRVEIVAEARSGAMRIAEAAHPGTSGTWFNLLSHYCHPAQANDGLAGVVVMIEALSRIRNRHPRPIHGYRFLTMPETIGSSIYAATHEAELDASIGAVFSEMSGADAPLQLVRSRRGDTYIDRVFEYVLSDMRIDVGRIMPFRKGWGNDELVFDSPGVGVPSVSLDRYPFAHYHTHHDDLTRVSSQRLEETVDVLLRVVDVLEGDFIPHPRQRVPVYLSRYDLYADWTYARDRYDVNAVLIEAMWSGLSVFDLALKYGLPVDTVAEYVGQFAQHGLIDKLPVDAAYARSVRFQPGSGEGLQGDSWTRSSRDT